MNFISFTNKYNFQSKFLSIVTISLLLCFAGNAQTTSWPTIKNEMRPGTRWWWLGSAVDQANLTYNLKEYTQAGIGTVEITPIYGVQNNDGNDIPFLSAKWLKMLAHTEAEANKLGMSVDMNTGTGWPFGGPEVTLKDAAATLVTREYNVKGGGVFAEKIVPEESKQKSARLQRLMAYNGKKSIDYTNMVNADRQTNIKVPKGNWKFIAIFCGNTFQQVKRAAPGGEGYVMDHFSTSAVKNYLNRFEKAFATNKTSYPKSFFNDSYEVYNADWTEDIFEQFYKRRGYKLENHFISFLNKTHDDKNARLISDYRETLSELLLENFTQQWTSWAHKHGSLTRNQAHGSPGNLIDLYASVDIPECEGFGLSNFNIKGLRTDSLTRKNDSELSMLKYASSAAHISGKQLVSSETFTWLTEHFRTSLSQCKPDMDLMFVAGVNHMNFHGTTYSPKEAAWPGWKFYASIDMSPTNSIWKDAPALMNYITRCQSFLQMGKPDNDFLVYLPVYDVWHNQSGRLLQFSIHDMEKRMPEFIHVVNSIYKNGYDVDYISDRFILSASCKNGNIITESGAAYKALILPAIKKMPVNVLQHITKLTEQGATIVFTENYPTDVPGFANQKKRNYELMKSLKKLSSKTDFKSTEVKFLKLGRIITGSDYTETLKEIGVQPEEMVTKFGLHAIRRLNNEGHHYFISALHKNDMDEWVTITVPTKSAQLFNPMNGESGKAEIRTQNGKTQVHLQLKSGESLILKTFTDIDIQSTNWNYLGKKTNTIELKNSWTLHFNQSEPQIKDTFKLVSPVSWTVLANETLKTNSGTGIYKTSFSIDNISTTANYILNLGDVRESAQVYVNGKNAGIVWAAPFECNISKLLQTGKNTLSVEVTNIPANRIAGYDRRNVNWRNFKEINIVNINYKNDNYGKWEPMESGLCSPVTISIFE